MQCSPEELQVLEQLTDLADEYQIHIDDWNDHSSKRNFPQEVRRLILQLNRDVVKEIENRGHMHGGDYLDYLAHPHVLRQLCHELASLIETQ